MASHTQVATLHTTLGDIKVNLLGNHAPKTVKNFVGLATGDIEWTHPATGKVSKDPLYDGVIFHRIIDNFMIQGGDPLGQGTNGSQFFITTVPTTWLQGKHTIFGEVADDASKEVVKKIEAVEKGANDKPRVDVVINSITVEDA